MENEQAQIVVTRNGPYVVPGHVPLAMQVIGTNPDCESCERGGRARLRGPKLLGAVPLRALSE